MLHAELGRGALGASSSTIIIVKRRFNVYASIRKLLGVTLDATHRKYTLIGAGACVVVLYISLWASNSYLMQQYTDLEPPAILDRNGVVLAIQPNAKERYGRYVDSFPERVKDILIQKEDRFFYWHPGINPVSTVRAIGLHIIGRRSGGASTITQQLVKNILRNEQHRSFSNKIIETFGAFSMELFNSKETLLTMYANSVYMGTRSRGWMPQVNSILEKS